MTTTDRCRHERFGEGTIVSRYQSCGVECAVVEFDDGTTRRVTVDRLNRRATHGGDGFGQRDPRVSRLRPTPR